MNQAGIVYISGNIGVGKTSLSLRLSQKLNIAIATENPELNPFLASFYQDMKRWAFHSQLFYLKERMKQAENLNLSTYIVDRSIYEDAEVFAHNLHLQGSMTKDEWSVYLSFYHFIRERLPYPQLLVYLKADVSTLEQRIAKRARSYEKSLERSYLESLNNLYNRWFDNYRLGPKIVIDTNQYDFVASEEDLEKIYQIIRNALPSA